MKFTCSRCEKIFVKPHPAMLIVTGKRILFFCTVRCRDNFDLRSGEDRRLGVESRQFKLAEYKMALRGEVSKTDSEGEIGMAELCTKRPRGYVNQMWLSD